MLENNETIKPHANTDKINYLMRKPSLKITREGLDDLRMNKPSLQMTQQGIDDLQNELLKLKSERPGVLTRMVEAREQGDLSENAGYHAAKDRLGFIDGRTRQLKELIRQAEVVRSSGNETVDFGSTVKISNETGELNFTIVSNLEADPSKGRLSDQSPIGSALIGKKVGETVQIQTPDGSTAYKVISIN